MTDKSPTKLELVVSRFDFFAFTLPYLGCYNLAPRQILLHVLVSLLHLAVIYNTIVIYQVTI